MKRAVMLILAASAPLAFAAESPMKPGLWEAHVTKMVQDGKDMTPQISGALAQANANADRMQAALANLPPDKRAMVENMMKSRISGDGSVRMCISPEMAKRAAPPVDPKGQCQRVSTQLDGNHLTYEVSCNINGRATKGKGETVLGPDLIATRMDVTTTAQDGTSHVMHNESEMRYVGADCGDVKPLEVPGAAH